MQNLASVKQSWLIWFLRGTLILGAFFLLARSFDLQIIKGKYYTKLSDSNSIREVFIHAPRGKIIARGGEIIATNTQTERTIELGNNKLNIKDHKRDYPLKEKAAHLIGFVGETNEEEVGKVNPDCISKGVRNPGQLTGRSGLELEYECKLAGIGGKELFEVDTSGKKTRTLGKINPIAGEDITTTIHFGLQKKAAELTEATASAIIVTDTKGEVLALHSTPSFDPNNPANYLKRKNLPFFNRVLSGGFPPGSVFKPTVALAGLEEKSIDQDYKYEDTGKITLGDFSYTNWYLTQYGKTEGEIDLVRAIARSTDTFFYKLGELIGIDDLTAWAAKLGYGRKTGIDLPSESSGLLPTPSWKKRNVGERWFLGNTYHLAIGQGDLLATPLQVNKSITSLITNKICTPHIVGNKECVSLGADKKNIDIIKEGMRQACAQGGTGFTFFNFKDKHGVEVGCKTGTAQTQEEGVTHAWFSVFAPFNNPEIVATVLVEKGGSGSEVAGDIARNLLDYWFEQR